MERENWKRTIDALAAKWDISAAVSVWSGDEVLHDAVYGYADRAAERPLREDQRYCFSITSELL
ncbi:MAG: serine hydrolase, partial [bacterium]|nr:serine hydrolase [bacterium]